MLRWDYEPEPCDADFFAKGALGQDMNVPPGLETVIVRLNSRASQSECGGHRYSVNSPHMCAKPETLRPMSLPAY